MDIETLNPYVVRILISARDEDSMSSIAKRIGLSYGWTHKWISVLIKEGVFKEKWKGIILQKDNPTYKKIMQFIKNTINPINLYYSLLPLIGVSYSLTQTDAVYVWTKGGYNIARYRKFYPIFIKIEKKDYKLFLYYCNKLGLKVKSKNGVFYEPKLVEKLISVKNGDYNVDSLEETIDFMKNNIYNFEPALEMVDEMYHKKLGYKYKEVSSLYLYPNFLWYI